MHVRCRRDCEGLFEALEFLYSDPHSRGNGTTQQPPPPPPRHSLHRAPKRKSLGTTGHSISVVSTELEASKSPPTPYHKPGLTGEGIHTHTRKPSLA